MAAHSFQKERDQGEVKLFGQIGVDSFEGLDVVRSIVTREAHSGQEDANTGLLKGLDHGDLVGAGGGHGQAAETIVAAEFENHDVRFGSQDVGQALNSVSCSIATDSEIDDVVVVTGRVEESLKIVGVTPAWRDTQAGGQAVAEGHDHRAGVGWGFG